MKLGLKRDEVRLVQYLPEWRAEFARVKEEILSETGLGANRIEHIGSTSIVGIKAKPIIDIVVGVDDFRRVTEELFTAFRNIGFLRLRVERPEEIVLAKFTDDTYEVKTHFIHLTNYKGELWEDLIFFRDYLNQHPHVKAAYEKLKCDYTAQSSTGITQYTNHKEAFVKDIYAKRKSS
ncbi:GrpB-like predicted nucleotidyltransferase (UPF0157 family) [Cerasibacillus quisquiliarum]|uniref:Dephospho-CoA kinase n=1 Tax=Cerasibacillus quisquiliarum TaxID=227865 RepID=A0A511V152_9BACI|nr:GrpB family protein [Cerasibacillus quisquiliarum]MBB5146857.1 GrpB-like predicted nucleotidyltransferase (UPF0157 family) [Cerasibacillus quisquiliarum]GEN31648.1 hypothetical protein CQU01_18860 [Cerasibacillus quisquiliarum]